MAAATGGYTFSQQPRAVYNRAKYRPPQDAARTNIMFDMRVMRGNTYAAEIIPESSEGMRPASDQTSRRFARTRMLARKRKERQMRKDKPVEEAPLPSYEYLEELAPPNKDLSTQTFDMEYDGEEEDSVPFKPKPAGTDVQTWMEANDLLDFDMCCEPVLQVLVGKSLDQGMTEVKQEEQMKQLKRHRQQFEQERGLTFAGAQRLESELQRGNEEVERRIQQQKNKVTEDKLESRVREARARAKDYYDQLQNKVIDRLAKAGHFYDPVLNQVEGSFMPWMVEKVARKLQDVQRMRENTDKILDGAVGKGLQELADEEERVRLEAEAEAERLRLEEEEKKRVEEELAKQKYQQELADRLAAEAAALANQAGDGDEGDEGEEQEN